jgi:hypothetical protein
MIVGKKIMKLRDKFHSYLEKYRCAIQAERDFGPYHETTKSYYAIANQSKLELQELLVAAEKYVEEKEREIKK